MMRLESAPNISPPSHTLALFVNAEIFFAKISKENYVNLLKNTSYIV